MAYWSAVAVGVLLCTALCVGARRRPGRWVRVANVVLAGLLLADAVIFIATPVVDGYWTVGQNLPLAICDVVLVLAALALLKPSWWPLVEITYFVGLAGTLQAVATPDLSVRFPHLVFFEFVTGHLGIVIAALFLVVGQRLRPRAGAVQRVWLLTAAYVALTGAFDAATGANYNFLARLPAHGSLLSVLGPWPWYVVSAAVLAAVILVVLDLPFHHPHARGVRELLAAAVHPEVLERRGPDPARPAVTPRPTPVGSAR